MGEYEKFAFAGNVQIFTVDNEGEQQSLGTLSTITDKILNEPSSFEETFKFEELTKGVGRFTLSLKLTHKAIIKLRKALKLLASSKYTYKQVRAVKSNRTRRKQRPTRLQRRLRRQK